MAYGNPMIDKERNDKKYRYPLLHPNNRLMIVVRREEVDRRLRHFDLTLLERFQDMIGWEFSTETHDRYNAIVDFVLDKAEEIAKKPAVKRVATHFNSAKEVALRFFGRKPRQ